MHYGFECGHAPAFGKRRVKRRLVQMAVGALLGVAALGLAAVVLWR